jgi:hypothetical protein
MKKILYFYFIITVSIFAQFGNPKIVPHENEFDFGDIQEGEKVVHKFVIFNRGLDTLKISKVKASCGCTAANPSKTELMPEDSTSIRVEFNSTRRKGQQRKFVYIFSNDPDTPQLRLTFHANIISEEDPYSNQKPSIKLSKYNHNFGNVKEGVILDLVVNVMNNGDSYLNISKIKSSCGCTAALMSNKNLKPNETSELKIEFDTKNLTGQIARTITLFTNDPKHPTRVLTLIANIEKG